MAKLDPEAVMLFVMRMIAAIGFIVFMMFIFFSFKVEVHEDSMKRFVFEASDVLANSPLTDHPSLFNPQKLNDAEKADPNRNIELQAYSCEYGYSLEIESLTDKTGCQNAGECSDFCGSACGAGADCKCEKVCKCKKFDEWHDKYQWKYGYTPFGAGKIAEATSEFPVGISVGGSVIPATMKITAYDSLVTRLTCVTTRAYELKQPSKVKFVRTQLYFQPFPVFKKSGTHACMYAQGDSSGTLIPVDCRYFPALQFEDFEILKDLPQNEAEGIVVAYPVKSAASCSEIKSNPSVIAGKNDNIGTVVLCTELPKK